MRDPKGVLSGFDQQCSRVSSSRPSRRTLLGGAAGLFAAAGSGTRSWGADAFPSQPIKVLVPYTPGASSDTLMRLVGAKLSESVNQPVIIENRPGGGGAVAAMAVKEATPDGYTLLMGHSGIYAFIPVLFPKEMRYDPINDFAPITPLISFPTILVVPGDSPAKSVKELIALARSKPNGLTYASQGVGNTAHLIGEMFKARANIPLVHVPYHGVAPALTDLMANRVDMMFSSYLSAGPYIQGGKLRMLAIASDKRSPEIPDVPTMAEAGAPGVGIDTWFGVLGPRGTPAPVVDKLNAEFTKAVNSPEVKKLVLPQVANIIPSSPADFKKFLVEDLARVQTIVNEAHIDASGASLN
jgi:tripartite-type tricarboxylate transporter receptor subunit TctC